MTVIEARVTAAMADVDRDLLCEEEIVDLRELYAACRSWRERVVERAILAAPAEVLRAIRDLGSLREFTACAPAEDRDARARVERDLLRALLSACVTWEIDRRSRGDGSDPFESAPAGVFTDLCAAVAHARRWL